MSIEFAKDLSKFTPLSKNIGLIRIQLDSDFLNEVPVIIKKNENPLEISHTGTLFKHPLNNCLLVSIEGHSHPFELRIIDIVNKPYICELFTLEGHTLPYSIFLDEPIWQQQINDKLRSQHQPTAQPSLSELLSGGVSMPGYASLDLPKQHVQTTEQSPVKPEVKIKPLQFARTLCGIMEYLYGLSSAKNEDIMKIASHPIPPLCAIQQTYHHSLKNTIPFFQSSRVFAAYWQEMVNHSLRRPVISYFDRHGTMYEMAQFHNVDTINFTDGDWVRLLHDIMAVYKLIHGNVVIMKSILPPNPQTAPSVYLEVMLLEKRKPATKEVVGVSLALAITPHYAYHLANTIIT